MSTLQSNSTLENKPIDNTVSDANVLVIRELIRHALRKNPFLTLEQFIQQTFDVNDINKNPLHLAHGVIPFIFGFAQYEMLDTAINVDI